MLNVPKQIEYWVKSAADDLFYLAKKAEIQLPEEKQQICQILMKYQLEGRYPESFPKNPDGILVQEYFEKTKELLEWLKMKL